jgi:beta-glucanase (GH16 family)
MKNLALYTVALLALWSCSSTPEKSIASEKENILGVITLALNQWEVASLDMGKSIPQPLSEGNWLQYSIDVPETGRYQLRISGTSEKTSSLWVEDYADNTLDRVFNVSGDLLFDSVATIDGVPLAAGTHQIKLHCKTGTPQLETLTFSLMQRIPPTPTTLKANMEGKNWSLIWSDEFEGQGLPDTSKWVYNMGNWGWGNNELQYYTQNQLANARLENGHLVIEAHKVNDTWTSARLTTQGKVAFKNGKITIRAKVPSGRGTWSAGWLLGDMYVDEMSWPTCGEIDILECVGYEIDDATGSGFNHTSCHTPAYYFKKDNQITGKIAVENMTTRFNDYTIIWYSDRVEGFVNDVHYYTYDKNATPEEWPFETPQNLILNLAIGGGWGGAKGIDESLTQQTLYIDYVRIYELTD